MYIYVILKNIMAVRTSKDILNTIWYFNTSVYYWKSRMITSAIKTNKYINRIWKKYTPNIKRKKKVLGNKDYLKVKDHE